MILNIPESLIYSILYNIQTSCCGCGCGCCCDSDHKEGEIVYVQFKQIVNDAKNKEEL